MKQFFRRNSLSIVLFGLFLLFQIGMSIVGLRQYNAALGQAPTVMLHLGQITISPFDGRRGPLKGLKLNE